MEIMLEIHPQIIRFSQSLVTTLYVIDIPCDKPTIEMLVSKEKVPLRSCLRQTIHHTAVDCMFEIHFVPVFFFYYYYSPSWDCVK